MASYLTLNKDMEAWTSTDVILSLEDKIFRGSPYEVFRDLCELSKEDDIHELDVTLTNSSFQVISTDSKTIVNFLIQVCFCTELVGSSAFMFDCKFGGVTHSTNIKNKTKDGLYNIAYVLSRPSNPVLDNMNSISLVYRSSDNIIDYSSVFSIQGKLDIEYALHNWKRTFPYYAYSFDQNLEETKRMLIDIVDITETEIKEEFNEQEEVAEKSIKEYAIQEEIKTLKDIITSGDTEHALLHVDILDYLVNSYSKR